MNGSTFIIQTLLFIVIRQSVSSATRHWTHRWTCQPDNNFHYNLCHDPIHHQTTISVGNAICNIPSDFKRILRTVTLDMDDYLQQETRTFDTEYIRCEYCTQQLQRENLTNIIGMETSNEFVSNNPVTSTYLKMANFLRLFHKLWCLHSTRADQQCSLPFSQTFHRLKMRLLGKWWFVQNSCGQHIDHRHCEASVPAFSNSDLRCEDIRDIIYILLRDARALLNESLTTIDYI